MLRVLVILIALMSIGACVLAYMNYSKREAIAGRAHALETFVVRLAGSLEAVGLPDAPAVDFPERDVSEVSSREVENPERSDFWSSYKYALEADGQSIPRLDYNNRDTKMQLRNYYQLDPVTGKPVIDSLTGKPSTEGDGTMDALLDDVLDRASAQYSVLCETRAQLTNVRKELVTTIEELNGQKQDARADKRTIVSLNEDINKAKADLAARETELETAKEQLAEAESKAEELKDEIDKLTEDITALDDKVKEQEQTIRDLRGRATNPTILPTVAAAVEAGVLTPGVKGKIVHTSDEWKYALVEFSPEFMTELIGPNRDRALPQVEVMVRRPGDADIDDAFVTRLRLRQAIRNKNIVIADILTDWEQKKVEVGDIVFN